MRSIDNTMHLVFGPRNKPLYLLAIDARIYMRSNLTLTAVRDYGLGLVHVRDRGAVAMKWPGQHTQRKITLLVNITKRSNDPFTYTTLASRSDQEFLFVSRPFTTAPLSSPFITLHHADACLSLHAEANAHPERPATNIRCVKLMSRSVSHMTNSFRTSPTLPQCSQHLIRDAVYAVPTNHARTANKLASL